MVSVLESDAQKNVNKQRRNYTTSKESCGLRLAGCEGRDSLDMLERNQSINAQLYCQQLQRVTYVITQKKKTSRID